MLYRIYFGDSKCEKCGRKHKKVFEIDGKPYGSTCAREILGLNLTAPTWLYKMADDYIRTKLAENRIEVKVADFEVNFWNENGDRIELGGMNDMIYTKACKIDGKRVSISWQLEIANYLNQEWDKIK